MSIEQHIGSWFVDYNYLDYKYMKQLFSEGWNIIINKNIEYDGITWCKDKLIEMKFWDIHLLAHELTHKWIDCI